MINVIFLRHFLKLNHLWALDNIDYYGHDNLLSCSCSRIYLISVECCELKTRVCTINNETVEFDKSTDTDKIKKYSTYKSFDLTNLRNS